MGKIADALERHNKEKVVKIEGPYSKEPKLLLPEEPDTTRAREVYASHDANPKLVVLSRPDSADAETFKLLRGQILFARNRKRTRNLLVTSTFPGEGKSFVASNLAASLALSIDESVLLIDCDLRRPSVHKMFDCRRRDGLHECLVHDKKVDDLLIQSQIDKLSILPAGNSPPNPSELLSSELMRNFMEELHETYSDRFIVLDSAPSHITAEAKVLSEYVDGIIFVIRAHRSPRKEIHRAIDNLEKEKIIGLVFNGYSRAHKKYAMYYEKYYRGNSV
jgi:exopolysaccharide/PEP-CTERM locus tyrosine autokinase